MAPVVNDGTISEPQAAAVGEVWKAFSAFFASMPENQRMCLSFAISRNSEMCHRYSLAGRFPSNHRPLAIKHADDITRRLTNYIPVVAVCNIFTRRLQRGCE